MITQEIENIIIKYLFNNASGDELDKLSLWLEDSKNKELFSNYVKINYAINHNMKNYDANQAKKYVLDIINKDKNTFKLRRYKANFLKYAAVAIVMLSIGYVYNKSILNNKEALIIPEERITLQLENGSIKVINQEESTQLLDANGHIVGTQTGKQLLYSKSDDQKTLTYNTLTVPYGKRFDIQLSDGTKLKLNAGSSLKFPINFIKGENRQVFLKGEAFFEVVKDADHPFIVNAEEINVRVLGTKFNISSYPEDVNINTVLVEGSVVAYKNGVDYLSDKATKLTPNYLAAWNKKSLDMQVSETDVDIHTAWIDGKLVLQEVAFKDLLKKLERQYNVTFINNNKLLESRYFTAKFDIEDIYQVLESLSLSGNFTYKFNKNQIIINP